MSIIEAVWAPESAEKRETNDGVEEKKGNALDEAV